MGHNHEGHDHEGHSHAHEEESTIKAYIPAIISFVLLVSGMVLQHQETEFFKNPLRLGWYLVAYALVGLPVNWEALKSIRRGDVFSEFFLMSIATIGAFFIGEYAEGVAVMLFYAIGELV